MPNDQLSLENVEATYDQLNVQQRAALAQEFMRGFQRAEDPSVDELPKLDPKKVTPQQLAILHQHAREKYPEVLGRVMRDPIVSALLSNFSAHEIATYVVNR